MRYWDASALAPLVVNEERTEEVRSWLAEDAMIVTWAWTRVEIASAVERRVREGRFTRPMRRQVLDRFEALWESWDEVTDVLAVRAKAMAVIARHPLRAADAAQLGAALAIGEQMPEGLAFACLDHRLNEAAEMEGLRVLSL